MLHQLLKQSQLALVNKFNYVSYLKLASELGVDLNTLFFLWSFYSKRFDALLALVHDEKSVSKEIVNFPDSYYLIMDKKKTENSDAIGYYSEEINEEGVVKRIAYVYPTDFNIDKRNFERLVAKGLLTEMPVFDEAFKLFDISKKMEERLKEYFDTHELIKEPEEEVKPLNIDLIDELLEAYPSHIIQDRKSFSAKTCNMTRVADYNGKVTSLERFYLDSINYDESLHKEVISKIKQEVKKMNNNEPHLLTTGLEKFIVFSLWKDIKLDKQVTKVTSQKLG